MISRRRAAVGVVGTVMAGGIALADPASAHTTSLGWGCEADGKTTFEISTWHSIAEVGEPSDNLITVDDVIWRFDDASVESRLPPGGDYNNYDDGSAHYSHLRVSLPLTPGAHVVRMGAENNYIASPAYSDSDAFTTDCVALGADGETALLGQTITFPDFTGATTASAPLTLAATASSGLPVSYQVVPGSQCTVTGSTLTVTGVGNCEVTATQFGDGTYAIATSVTKILTITAAPAAPADTTPPLIMTSTTVPDGTNGWFVTDAPYSFTVADGESAVSSLSGCGAGTVTEDTLGDTFECTATSLGGTSTESVTIKRDATGPAISGADVADTVWRSTALTASFTASDTISDLLHPADAAFDLTASAESTNATTPTEVTKTVTDNAGNSSTRKLSAFIDQTNPIATLVGGPANGQTYYARELPAAPTCGGTDAPSGIASCVVTGYSTAAGSRTVTATATDRAGNTHAVSSTYIVRDMSSTGFYQPVDMGGTYNVVKGGSTVPLKLNVLIDGVQQTDITAVRSFTTAKVSCLSGAGSDDLEMVTTGGTSLRYDANGAQLVQNWKTPTGAGTCYRATVTRVDGATISALFKLK